MSHVPPSTEAGLFGVEPGAGSDDLVIIGVPWEPSASYGRGTSKTPHAMIAASHQLDFFDLTTRSDVSHRVHMLPVSQYWEAMNARCIALADPIHEGVNGPEADKALEEINLTALELENQLQDQVATLLAAGKIVGILGGDHSSPLGALRATFAAFPKAGLLHFDAHHDLRIAYEGFTSSHASIMYNFLDQVKPVGPLVSVGIRDFCVEEFRLARDHGKVHTFYDQDLKKGLFQGATWTDLTQKILEPLPQEVYVSFDIDGLDPSFCPHTGTPVPGGISYDQAVYVLEALVASGRRLIGFDLCEVAPHPHHADQEWDLNVGARLLYKLCTLALNPPA